MATEPNVNQEEQNPGTGPDDKNQEKQMSESQVNAIVQSRLAKQEASIMKQYEGVDIELYNTLVADNDNKLLEEQKARGEFDDILNDRLGKKDTIITEKEDRISKLENELLSIKVDDAMLKEAIDFDFYNPEQVVELNRKYVKLNDTGEREVVDSKGKVRTTEKGDLMTLNDLYSEWAGKNKFAVKATPGGSGTNKLGGSSTETNKGVFKYQGKEYEDSGIKAKTN